MIDWTIHISDVVAVVAPVVLVMGAFYRSFQAFRDELRDVRRIVGHEGPPKGPSGLILNLQNLSAGVDEHERWLVRAGLDRRSGHERRERP